MEVRVRNCRSGQSEMPSRLLISITPRVKRAR